MIDGRLLLPELMLRLAADGIWPSERGNLESQNQNPILSPESIADWAPGERTVYFYPLPQCTIQTLIDGGDTFWLSEHAAPRGIDYNLAVAIGDFGLGSDAPLVLDYRRTPESPCVLRLQWSQDGNQWIKVSDSFDEFVAITGLASASPLFREQSGQPELPMTRIVES